MAWNYRGTAEHLEEQARRLRIAPPVADRARKNGEIHRANVLLGQLHDRHRRAPRDESGAPVFGVPELAQVKGTLGQAGDELDRLHALAATVEAMLAPAYAAFGLEPPGRPFRVRCDYDDPPAHLPPDLAPIRIQPGSRRDRERHGQLQDPQQRGRGGPRE